MNKLIESLKQIIDIDDYNWEKLFKSSQNYIEVLSISSSEDIKEMIKFVYDNHYMECPFWTKLIAFKILILQNPNDDEVKKWAIADIKMFGGPEWDEIVSNW